MISVTWENRPAFFMGAHILGLLWFIVGGFIHVLKRAYDCEAIVYGICSGSEMMHTTISWFVVEPRYLKIRCLSLAVKLPNSGMARQSVFDAFDTTNEQLFKVFGHSID